MSKNYGLVENISTKTVGKLPLLQLNIFNFTHFLYIWRLTCLIASVLDILVTTKLSRRAAHSSHSAALRDRNIIITSNKYSGKLAEISADISSHSTEHRTAAGDIALLLELVTAK